MALEAREISAMRNFAAGSQRYGYADQTVVTEFVALVPDSKRTKIAETLSALVMRGETMSHKGAPLTPATMAAIALELGR